MEKEISIKELAGLIESLVINLAEFQNETRHQFKEMRGRFERLEQGLLSPDEKQELLTTLRHYDKGLEEDVLGKRGITLTRDEYDAMAFGIGLPNRFDRIDEITVD